LLGGPLVARIPLVGDDSAFNLGILGSLPDGAKGS
jgi:hypothetical protein